LLLAVGSLFVVSACEEDVTEAEVVRPVRAIKVGDAEDLNRRSLPGRAKATQEVNLSFRVAGSLVSFPAQVGDKVATGDLLANLDPRDFEVRVRSVEAQLERSRSELDAMRVARPEDITRAEAGVRSAEADLNLANQDLTRLLNIQAEDAGAVAQAMIDQAQAAKNVTQAQLTNAQEELQIAKAGARAEDISAKEAENASLEASVDAARDDLSYTYLRAPFDGTVVATYVENFEDVQAKAAILRLVDTERIEMDINIPERSISNLPNVTNIRVEFDAFPGVQIPAEISEVGTEASQTTRTYPVTLIMDQPEGAKILPGMAGKASADVAAPGGGQGGGLIIPVKSLFSPQESQESFVWVVDPDSGQVATRAIVTGELTAFGVVVLDGLSVGEWVVTAGVNSLREGQQVRLVEQDGGEG
jgi:RND family efflux transporter MFP subunit